MTEIRRQLEWIHRNRTKRVRTQPVRDVLHSVAAGWTTLDPAVRQAVNEAFAGVDGLFRSRCRWALLADGTIVIFVNDASMVGPMRTQWLGKLTAELVRPRRDARIRKVEFRFGREGFEILEQKTNAVPRAESGYRSINSPGYHS